MVAAVFSNILNKAYMLCVYVVWYEIYRGLVGVMLAILSAPVANEVVLGIMSFLDKW